MELGMTPEEAATKKFFYGKGCEKCNNTGYKGRMGIYELLVMNDTLRDMVVAEASLDEFRDACRKYGMRTLREVGLEFIHDGLTTIEEIVARRSSTRSESEASRQWRTTSSVPGRRDRVLMPTAHDERTCRHSRRSTGDWSDERSTTMPTYQYEAMDHTGPRGQGHDRRLDPGGSAAAHPPEGLLRHQDLRARRRSRRRGPRRRRGGGGRRSRSRSARSRPSSSARSPASSRPCRTPACRSCGA